NRSPTDATPATTRDPGTTRDPAAKAPAAGQPSPRPPIRAPAAPSPSAGRSPAAAGWYAIDSNPYAPIFVDERKIGDTPLDRIPLSAGPHRVRAVLSDGRQRSFAID